MFSSLFASPAAVLRCVCAQSRWCGSVPLAIARLTPLSRVISPPPTLSENYVSIGRVRSEGGCIDGRENFWVLRTGRSVTNCEGGTTAWCHRSRLCWKKIGPRHKAPLREPDRSPRWCASVWECTGRVVNGIEPGAKISEKRKS